MPFFKTHEVSSCFYNVFLDKTTPKKVDGDSLNFHPMLSVLLHTGESKDFMVRYYKRSGDSSTEDTLGYFPCVVIQDFQPEIDKKRVYGKNFVEGIIDVINGTKEKIMLPIPMVYRFQVSAITNRLKEAQSINDWFMQNFDFDIPSCFMFNQVQTFDGAVGDVVPYSVRSGEVPREDGKFEYAYDYSLNTTVHAKKKDYVIQEDGSVTNGNMQDMVEKFVINSGIIDYATMEKFLVTNFEFSTKDPKFQQTIG